MIVIKIIINIQNKRKMAKMKTLFFFKKFKLQCNTLPNVAKPSTILIKKCQKKVLPYDNEIFSKQKNPFLNENKRLAASLNTKTIDILNTRYMIKLYI